MVDRVITRKVSVARDLSDSPGNWCWRIYFVMVTTSAAMPLSRAWIKVATCLFRARSRRGVQQQRRPGVAAEAPISATTPTLYCRQGSSVGTT
jgi:hypothetical protein